MKRMLIFLAIFMSLVVSLSAQGGWIDSSGKSLPDTESMKSEGDFGVQIVLTADEKQFQKIWYSSKTPPKLNATHAVRRGEAVSAMLIFHGCAPNKIGVCDAFAEFMIEAPGGARTTGGGGPLWSGKPAPQRIMVLGKSSMTVGFDASDPVGTYKVIANIRDKVSGKTLSVSAPLKVTE